jgi:hypothetical protein
VAVPGARSYGRSTSSSRASLFYLVARSLVRLLVGGGQQGQDDGSKDLEILVLRHQLRVLQRTAGPPRLRPIDRVLFAAASRVIPRPHRPMVLSGPERESGFPTLTGR